MDHEQPDTQTKIWSMELIQNVNSHESRGNDQLQACLGLGRAKAAILQTHEACAMQTL